MRLDLVVPEQPIAKGRPRAALVKGKVRVYTPSRTAKAEWLIKQHAMQAIDGRKPFLGPVRLTVTAFLRMPASIPKRDWATALPIKRPDADNYLKAALDGLAPCWGDDSQVVEIHLAKRYARDGEPPRWEISVEALA